jgi:hypothetical protein
VSRGELASAGECPVTTFQRKQWRRFDVDHPDIALTPQGRSERAVGGACDHRHGIKELQRLLP